MPDFATPLGAASPAHTYLAIAVQDPMSDLPVRLLAITWRTRRGALRLITINAATDAVHVHVDRWWGHISRHAIVLDGSEEPSAVYATWHR